MVRHTTFRYCLDPTVEQQTVLARHAGAARFAFNQSLRAVKTALTHRRADPDVVVPWSGFDLINAFNTWKKTADAGRVFVVDADGVAEIRVTGLAWRTEVCQQVFEEAAVDCGRALAAWSASRTGARKGRKVGFPRFKKKNGGPPSFRLRNKQPAGGRPAIRVGDARPRSVTLPGIGAVRVHDDTRQLRRLIGGGRARILFATVSFRGGRWWVSLNVEATDLHPAHHHPTRDEQDRGGWVGIDRGLTAFLVAATADGREVARIDDSPKALAAGIRRQRRLAKSVSRKEKGSHNRKAAAARLGRHHRKVRDIRRHFLHEVSNALVKAHDRIALEDLHVAGMLANHRLARAISDAAWAEFARMLRYKQAWRQGDITVVDRWFPSSKTCSTCGTVNAALTLSDRVFVCANGHSLDRDQNAAINLAAWAENHHHDHDRGDWPARDPQAGGPVINARRQDGSGPHPRVGETSLNDAGTDAHPTPGT
ncbi:RNA-guided endonuclease InsQ/TnpB family protein [Rhodococcus daqingensis]|uniref:RNA-guided endonuclease InsQ/TnpB family protein n=1 Tax=Rhodococcus daqingensis TaxID=2479363 RepID=A0ABW2S4U1_9NOCA